MAIFLLVLKIIGITLLSIISLLLLAVFLVLFVPVRYKVRGDKGGTEDSGIEAVASVTWLLSAVHLVFEYNENGTGSYIKIFGIRLRSGEEKEEARRKKQAKKRERQLKKEEKKREKEKEKEKEPVFTLHEFDEGSGEIKQERTEIKGRQDFEREFKPAVSESSKTEESEEKKESSADKLYKRIIMIKNKISDFCERMSYRMDDFGEKLDNFDYYYNALTNDARNRDALELIFRNIKRLFSAVRPRKVSGNIDYGGEDPADTGRMLAAAAVLYPLYGGRILINPDFENSIFAFDVTLKGRLYLIVVARVAAALWFNKKVKRLIRIMKKENENGR